MSTFNFSIDRPSDKKFDLCKVFSPKDISPKNGNNCLKSFLYQKIKGKNNQLQPIKTAKDQSPKQAARTPVANPQTSPLASRRLTEESHRHSIAMPEIQMNNLLCSAPVSQRRLHHSPRPGNKTPSVTQTTNPSRLLS